MATKFFTSLFSTAVSDKTSLEASNQNGESLETKFVVHRDREGKKSYTAFVSCHDFIYYRKRVRATGGRTQQRSHRSIYSGDARNESG